MRFLARIFTPVAPAFLLLAAFAFASCDSQKTSKPTLEVPKKQVAESKKEARLQCYQWTEGKSVANAKITIQNDSVKGTLEYLFYEKDNSRGTIKGIMRGDTIFADYTYKSEGTLSVMEVIFQIQGDKLVQGHGSMQEKNGKIVYVDPSRLDFITPFKGVICQ